MSRDINQICGISWTPTYPIMTCRSGKTVVLWTPILLMKAVTVVLTVVVTVGVTVGVTVVCSLSAHKASNTDY